MAQKELDLQTLSDKGGDNADLLLLDKIHAIEDDIATIKTDLTKEPLEDARVEKISMKLAAKLATLEKGDKGDTPTNDELLMLIRPLIPAVNDGEDGEDGRTPTEEELLKLIKPLIPIVHDGEDGKDAVMPSIDEIVAECIKKMPPMDMSASMEMMQTMKEELTARMDVLTKDSSRPIFGPGKTKIVEIDLSSLLDGSTKTFFLGTHFGIISVDGDSAPFGAFRRVVDYNESGKNIVFTANVDAPTALPTGHSLLVRVLK